MNRSFFVAILLLLALAGCNHNFQRGVEAFQQGNYAAALADLEPVAEAGNPEAQFRLAEMYANGLGVAQNDMVAVQWYERAAEQDLAAAQLELAELHAAGRGVAASDAMAAKWYEAAAGQGNGQAQLKIANYYAAGLGVEQNDAAAAKWYRMAAEQEVIEAQIRLADAYVAGRGIAEDPALAARWYRTAGERGAAEAQLKLAGLYATGVGLTKNRLLRHGMVSQGRRAGRGRSSIPRRLSLRQRHRRIAKRPRGPQMVPHGRRSRSGGGAVQSWRSHCARCELEKRPQLRRCSHLVATRRHQRQCGSPERAWRILLQGIGRRAELPKTRSACSPGQHNRASRKPR